MDSRRSINLFDFLLLDLQKFTIFLDSIRIIAYSFTSMKLIVYCFGMFLAVISAPFMGLGIGLYTFFISVIAFVEGINTGMINLLWGPKPKEPEDIWEKHVKRMADKSNLN